MTSIMFAKLSKRSHLSSLHIAIILISIRYCSMAPVGSPYVNFINDLKTNNCATPELTPLTSNSSATANSLSSSLMICQNLETVQHTKEAQFLCKEIVDNLKVVLCPNSKGVIQPLNITFSKNVCKDMGSLKNVPEDKIMMKKLADSFFCDLMCDEDFEKVCQVLLWSYQAQMLSEKAENVNEEATVGNPTQGNALNTGKPSLPEPSKAEGILEKTAEAIQEQSKVNAKQPSNTVVLGSQTSNSISEQQTQTHSEQTQSVKLDSEVKNTVHVGLKKQVGSNIVSLHQINEFKNMSLNLGPNAPQDNGMNGNDLPENDVEPQNPAGPDEIEEPHDKEDIFSHNELDSDLSPKEPSQPIDKKSPNPSNTLPHLIVNEESPKFPANDLPLPPAKIDVPGLSLNDNVDPHDGEEPGEEENPRTYPKAPEAESIGQAIKIEHPDHTEVLSQAKITTNQNDSSNTNEIVFTGIFQSLTTATEKKVTEVKSSSLVEPLGVSTFGQRATESLPVPSQNDASSSVVSPVSEDLSRATFKIEKMEGDGDAHEMPEDREPDQYTDLEKTEGDPDDEYARQEYDGIYEPSKSKVATPEKPNDVVVPKVDVEDDKILAVDEFAPRMKYGQDDVPLIPVVFPEQEDGHFFFYFLSMVLIIMAGYLIFHNKQKIIALIVEGRHERRRRSHGAGYKKLETK